MKSISKLILSLLLCAYYNLSRGQTPSKISLGVQLSPEITYTTFHHSATFYRHPKPMVILNGGVLLTMIQKRIMFKMGLNHFTHAYRYEFEEWAVNGAWRTEFHGQGERKLLGIEATGSFNYAILNLKKTKIYVGVGMSTGILYRENLNGKGVLERSNYYSTAKLSYYNNSANFGVGFRYAIKKKWTLDSRIKHKKIFINNSRFYSTNKTLFSTGIDISLNYSLGKLKDKKPHLNF